MNPSSTEKPRCTHLIKFRASHGSKVCDMNAAFMNSAGQPRCANHKNCKSTSSPTFAQIEEKRKVVSPLPLVSAYPTDDMDVFFSVNISYPSTGFSISSRVVNEDEIDAFIHDLYEGLESRDFGVYVSHNSLSDRRALFDSRISFKYTLEFIRKVERELEEADEE